MVSHIWIFDEELLQEDDPEKALKAFHTCKEQPTCEKCDANKVIPGTNTTFCDFLREHNTWLENRIDEAINS